MSADGENGELLTISLGPWANVVAAHYWNCTSALEAKSSVLYHQLSSGESVPRAVVVDWAGGSVIKKQFKMRKPSTAGAGGDEPMEEEDDTEYTGPQDLLELAAEDPYAIATGMGHTDPTAMQPPPSLPTNRPGPGEEVVHWWKAIVPKLSDRTVSLLKERTYRTFSEHNAFGEGIACWEKDQDAQHDVTDNIRYFFEGMDRCQGVQLFCDAQGMFGGMALEVIRYLRDEAPRASIFTTALFPRDEDEVGGVEPLKDEMGQVVDFAGLRRWERQGINRARCHALLSEASSAYVPIDVNTWNFARSPLKVNLADPVDTGAVAALGLSTALVAGHSRFAHFCDVLRPLPSMRLSALRCALPLPVSMQSQGLNFHNVIQGADFADYLDLSHSWPVDAESKAPLVAVPSTHVVSQIYSVKGLHELPQYERRDHTTVCNEFFADSFRTPRTVSHVHAHAQLLPGTFPIEVLPPHLNVVGWRDENAPAAYTTAEATPFQLPVAAHLMTTCASALMLDGVRRRVADADRRRHADQRMEADEWGELGEEMAAMVDEYDQGLLNTDDDW
eukprot:TRINITY_DN9201_c0_g1_i1.p1 TRINITY_DN9201_c0_g1~~TRINITY_DN9201_c0_g1_i1.p1  ORF type:complete len:560 (+),score=186.68 TRINITY_DN9201_c0_g1_i1:53-1732(+)